MSKTVTFPLKEKHENVLIYHEGVKGITIFKSVGKKREALDQR